MATAVFLHAHPDDEALSTGATMFEAEPDEGTVGAEGAPIAPHIDARGALDAERAAIRAHASQIPADSFFVALPDEAFAPALGAEWSIRRGAAAGDTKSTDLFAALDSE